MSRKAAYPVRKLSGRIASDYGISVVYDGELTEDSYFRSWQQVLSQGRLSLYPSHVVSGGNPLVAVKEAIKIKKKIRNCAEFWCVTDADDAQQKDIDQAWKDANENNIRLALSVRCFEVWISLHFGRSERPWTTEKEAIECVQQHGFPQYGNPRKLMLFSDLFPLTQAAIDNGIWLSERDCSNPQTNLYALVRKLKENLS